MKDEKNNKEEQPDFTPNPEESIPGFLPSTQLHLPWLPDWWRCFRFGPVSGRYEGEMTSPKAGRYLLDLRVDIDPRRGNSPVMDRISGDSYQLYRFGFPGTPTRAWRVYLESWIVDEPTVKWSRCEVEISGYVRFWTGVHPRTKIRVRIPWGTFRPPGPAEVTFIEIGRDTSSFSCARKSDCFRDMTMEVDVCQSVNAAPIMPCYDTHWHSTRPADLPRRTLTIEKAYRELGICVTINPDHTIIDDSASQFNSWSVDELHDAMETYFSQYAGTWPKWKMWGLLAGTFEISSVGGIMFDYWGAGEPPERQGFAVFRDHSWFNNLVPGAPANQDQALAMRHFLYTYVHEAGHAFNLMHSWDKGRPDSLSWMNYDWRYDARNGADSYWSDFRFEFDPEEMIHMRHGDRASVIMGGDPWSSGGHMEAPPGAMSQLEGELPIEFLLRSKEYFEFMEPVVIEFRLRNLLEDIPLSLDTRLNPEHGGVIVYIRRPDGRIVEYAPILCKLGTPQIQTLKPLKGAVEGEDRYSEGVFLSYGTYGFYFDKPGEYLARAVYQGAGDLLIHSNVHRIRIGNPLSKEEDRIAQDFFGYEVGMCLYLNGSRSPFLAKGLEILESIADRYKDTLLGVKVATTLAASAARPFFRIEERKLKKTYAANPKKALDLTEPALALYKREKAMSLSLAYHQVVRSRAEYLKTIGKKEAAKKEIAALGKDLADRGVNAPVLKDIKAFEKSL